MSESVLKLIPTDPQWTPGEGTNERAQTLLLSFVPDSTELKAVIRKNVEFIDQGENFERVLFPECPAELGTQWWQGAMEKAFPSCLPSSLRGSGFFLGGLLSTVRASLRWTHISLDR